MHDKHTTISVKKKLTEAILIVFRNSKKPLPLVSVGVIIGTALLLFLGPAPSEEEEVYSSSL